MQINENKRFAILQDFAIMRKSCENYKGKNVSCVRFFIKMGNQRGFKEKFHDSNEQLF